MTAERRPTITRGLALSAISSLKFYVTLSMSNFDAKSVCPSKLVETKEDYLKIYFLKRMRKLPFFVTGN